MITKDQLAAAMLRECDICLHLFSKLPAGAAEYRPSGKQRSTLELLRYLAISGMASMDCMAHADWKRFGDHAASTKEMPFDGFPGAMAKQKAFIEAFFAGISETALETQDAPLPGGGTAPLGVAILNGPFKWLAAYKLQLFLYAKACGATEIGTSNAWRGADMPPKA
ncbi:MAG TPA: hypothetical protein VFF76_08865 [Holophagaceae bacterium]|jgi:hypothetical protein|nr:hypothetical protein [Holophagaceae bacterium]